MVSATRRPRGARSTKVRPEAIPDPDTGQLGTFPPPSAHSEQLAANNLRLAKAMANRLAMQTRMPFDDLFLVAAQGLLKGCRLYDPGLINPDTGRPYAISTKVVPYIRGAMAHWLRDRGHSSGVRFPDRWRDHAPKVRRLAADGASLEAVMGETGLSAEDVEGILSAQSATCLLDPDAYLAQASEPDPLDEAEEFAELADALRLADEAHAALRWADRRMIEAGWDAPRRRLLAPLPHGQFVRRVQLLLRGQKLQPPEEQQSLSLELPAGPADGGSEPTKRRLTDPVEIIQAVQQLALFDACHDPGSAGKTAAAGIESDGAAADQPSHEQGRSAVVPSPTPEGGAERSGAGC